MEVLQGLCGAEFGMCTFFSGTHPVACAWIRSVMSLPPPDLPPPDETPEPDTASPPPASSPGKEAPQPRTGSQRTPEQADGEGAGKTETDFGSTKSKLDSELIVAQITEAVVFPICGKGWPLMIPALVLAGLVTLVGWIPFVGSTSSTLVWFYLLLVNGRLMGRLYVKHRKAIGW